jgi:hypothetical protein
MQMRAAPAGDTHEIEEYELPCSEAMLAGTLALMTGYSQALQAERDPAQRLLISLRIAHNLERLSGQAGLSAPFRALSAKLAALWQQMARCTANAGADCADAAALHASASWRSRLH